MSGGAGGSVSDHMAVVRKQRRTTPRPGKELPPELAFLWLVWLDLHATRPVGWGVNPISYAEIDAYSRVTDNPLTPWQASIVRMLDDAYLEQQAKQAKT